ncbi:hypothetical protein M9Y10_011163 [Tritrichomonas musculus]|uniref:Uncharacterized protein n=1 Tax=Tritrichomonas musculus TaxID=1915356 RepID=A0ABR2IIW1_9EUKA
MEEENISEKTAQSQIEQLLQQSKETSQIAILMSLCNQTEPSIQQIISTYSIPTTNEGNREKERITNRLNGFNPKDNTAWREITNRFGNNIKQPELLSIATVLANNANIKLDRDAKRRKSVLIKWFEENWKAILPFLDYVVLEDVQH